ncbi:uncharacterized protein IL334_002851 [Kwoniella shivajii]|uniref:phenylalanine--tRNA ligase n=1 Tax=Kwoniella shivajii TaxID=564305 RepID=A0ABZ1CXL2_9TREE|nr:hypothetical protein IL334_002851 [Kwoniella shivajii]
MPTITVDKAELYRRLEREYSTHEFDELCFDFGIELDEDTTEDVEDARAKGLPTPPPQLKIEIPANRYDLLCLEGLARSLRIFLEKELPPTYTLSVPEKLQEVYTSPLRPYFASAIIRLSRPMNQLEYESFIDLQDKLHQNLCRQRKFVAIGTHDLDTIQGPFRYMCKDPKEIRFAPLNKDQEYTAKELMSVYEIVAGKTKNIFIDTTATDKTKLIEPVKIIMPDGSSHLSPPLAPRSTTASSSYINAATGLTLSREEICKLLTRMSLNASPSTTDADALDVQVPATRPDILHECDIMEDAAIAYGFNNLPQSMPTTNTVAKAFPVNRLGDVIRKECAMAGWIEALPLILNFKYLNRPDPGNYAIHLANPKSLEYQVVRTSLLPGMLKTVRENKALPLPMKIFEVSDVAVQDPKAERQSRNYRRLCAVYMDRKAGFEVAHGLLDRVMQILGVPFIEKKESDGKYGYYIASADASEPTPSTSGPLSTLASSLKSALPDSKKTWERDIVIGSLGILHPSVLGNFELTRPCSSMEIDVEPLL